MKKILLILFIVNCSLQIGYSQSGWFWQNPLPQGNTLRNVRFINSNTGFAVGDAGTILKTTNAGINWIDLYIEIYSYNEDVFFINPSTGFVVGDGIFKSTDGGVTWVQKGIAQSFGIRMLNDTVIYAIGNSRFYKSTDAGENWQSINTGFYTTRLNDIYFFNINTGIIVGFPDIILRTTNGGLNWLNTIQPDSQQNHYYSISFANSNTGAVTSGHAIYKTTNAGINWACEICNIIPFPGYVNFNNNGNGISMGNVLYLSSNYGNNWYQAPMPALNVAEILNVNYTGTNDCFAVGSYGEILKSTNNGITWLSLSENSNLNFFWDACIVNPNLELVAGDEGIIFRSSNGGQNWAKVNQDTSIDLTSISFAENNLGIATGSKNFILRSTDLGLIWSKVNSQYFPNYIQDVKFIDQNNVVASGADGKFLKSSDGGINWRSIYVGQNTYLMGISILSDNIIYLSGSTGKIFKSFDSGENWQLIYNDYNSFFHDICFFNSDTGLVSVGSTYILRTTNGGSNWFVDNSVSNVWQFSKVFSGTVYTLSTTNQIYKTTDFGFNWTHNNFQVSADYGLFGVSFLNENTGIVAGLNGIILKTTTGGEPIGIQPISNEVPNSFILHQNYPNPFNPVTKIKFQIPATGLMNQTPAKLIIYDITGREVATLLNEQLSPGTYEVNWDGTNYASGVYFYQLQAGDFIQTKKMVLIK